MLRKACLAALLAALAIPGYGAKIRPDSYDIRLDIESGPDANAYKFPPVSGSIGYFPVQNLEFGGLLGLRNADYDSYWINGSVWELGLFAEKHFDVNFNFHPLLGVRLSLLDGKDVRDDATSDTAYQAFLYAGGKVFLNENTAIAINGGVAFGSEDIYNVDTTKSEVKDPATGETTTVTTTDGDSIGLIVDVGLRHYF